MNTAMYLRKSRAEELSDTVEETLKRHKEILLEYAERNNLNITKIYEEVVSGESLCARPKMLELLAAVEQGQYDAVLCMDIDRLGRGAMSDQGIILETLKNAGTKIITPRKVFDLSNEMDETYSEFETFLARQELKAIKRRMQRGIRKTVEEGGYLSNAPYGYRKTTVNKRPTLEINEEEARYVRMIYSLYVNQNMGCQQIAQSLNAMGAKPHRAGLFGRTSVMKILRNPVYIGKVVWNQKARLRKGNSKPVIINNPKENWTVVDGLHPPILETETFQCAQRIRSARSRPPVIKDRAENPLAGLVRCANCGSLMQRQASRNGAARLVCTKRGCIASASLALIESAVLNCLESRFGQIVMEQENSPCLPDQKNRELLATLETQKRGLRQQLEKLHDLLEQGVYDPDTFLTRQNVLKNKMEELDKIGQAFQYDNEIRYDNYSKSLFHLSELYSGFSPIQKNQILKSFMQKIIYSKQKGAKAAEFSLDLYLKPFDLP